MTVLELMVELSKYPLSAEVSVENNSAGRLPTVVVGSPPAHVLPLSKVRASGRIDDRGVCWAYKHGFGESA
jgi:hypothetical protein